MEFEQVIKNREAVRKFKNDQITKEQLDLILNAGNLACTAKDLQPQRIYVCQSEEALAKIDKASPCRYGAPTVLLIAADKAEAFSKENYNSYEMDATIVATHMVLEAENVGVASLWVLRCDNILLKEQFDLPDSVEPLCLIMLGYRDESYQGNPRHSIRKNLEETVFYK